MNHWLINCCMVIGIAGCISCKQDVATHERVEEGMQPGNASGVLKEPFLRKYMATDKDGNSIELTLINWTDGYLSGRWFEKNQEIAEVYGEKLTDSTFDLRLLAEGVAQEQIMHGTFLDSVQFELRTDGNNEEAVSLLFVEVSSEARSPWEGNWYFDEIWDKGVLMIGNVRRDSFDFALQFLKKGSLGNLDAEAWYSGNLGRYASDKYGFGVCRLRFELLGDSVEVIQESDSFACGFGVKARADGVYYRHKPDKKPVLSVGDGPDAVFPNESLDAQFRQLVGEDYERFAYNFKEVRKAQEGMVTIAYGTVPEWYEGENAIIAYDQTCVLWAAVVVDDDEGEGGEIWFYDAGGGVYNGKFPPAFEEWRAGMEHYRVVFKGLIPEL